MFIYTFCTTSKLQNLTNSGPIPSHHCIHVHGIGRNFLPDLRSLFTITNHKVLGDKDLQNGNVLIMSTFSTQA